MDPGDEAARSEPWPVAQRVLSNIFLFLLIFGMAGTTDLPNFRRKLKNYRGVGTGLGCQFLLLPFLGFASISLFQIDTISGIMLLIVTTSPGGGFSGWWCSLGNADLALSVAMTTVSTIMSIGMLPLNLFIYVTAIYDVDVPIAWEEIMITVAVVIAAVLAGLAAGTRWPAKKKMFNRLGTFGGIANIVVGLIASSNESANVWDQPPEWWFGVAFPCVLGLVVAFVLARVLKNTNPESVAICIESCYQNTALAITVAVSLFGPKDGAFALLVPLYYGVVEIFLIAIFVLVAWQLNWTYADRKTNFFKCLSGNYQPDSEDAPPSSAPEAVAPAGGAMDREGERGKDKHVQGAGWCPCFPGGKREGRDDTVAPSDRPTPQTTTSAVP